MTTMENAEAKSRRTQQGTRKLLDEAWSAKAETEAERGDEALDQMFADLDRVELADLIAAGDKDARTLASPLSGVVYDSGPIGDPVLLVHGRAL